MFGGGGRALNGATDFEWSQGLTTRRGRPGMPGETPAVATADLGVWGTNRGTRMTGPHPVGVGRPVMGESRDLTVTSSASARGVAAGRSRSCGAIREVR